MVSLRPATNGLEGRFRKCGDRILISLSLTAGKKRGMSILSPHFPMPAPPGDVYAAERVRGGRHAAIMRYDLNRASERRP
jgi:hypothetical protein